MGRRGPIPGSIGAQRISKARKAAWANPAVRAKMSAASKAAWARSGDALSPEQTAEIVDEIKRNVRPYFDIAEDWLVSCATIARIAREAGAARCGGAAMTMQQIAMGKDREALQRYQVRQLLPLRAGLARKTIYLNGGSETRRASIEAWKEYADALGVPFQNKGSCIVIIGFVR